MALSFDHGFINWTISQTAGTVITISGLAFQPKAIRFYWLSSANTTDATGTGGNMRRGIGFATSTTNRRCVSSYNTAGAAAMDCSSIFHNAAIVATTDGAGTVVALLDLNSITSDGFTVIVDDQTPNNLVVFWEAWGGSDITNVTIGDIAEPAATGTQNYTATGFTSTGTDQVVMLAGVQSTAVEALGQVNDSGLFIGYTTGTASAENIVIVGNNDDGSAAADTDGYARAGECLAMITVAGGNPSARAVLSAFGTDLFTLNWTARATTSRRSIYMAIKGGSWKTGSYTINGNSLNATTTVSGLSFAPVGVLFMGRMTTESAAGTATAEDRISLGTASSTSSRRSMGVLDENGTATVEVDYSIEYDSILVFPNASATLQSTYDLNAMNSDGFQVIVDTAGGVASEWQGYLAFGNAPVLTSSLVYNPMARMLPFLVR
jgi:hypothetical protein